MEILTEFLDRFVENIASMFGDQCEIVVHDFQDGYDRSVVKIVNGHVSGRTVGACPTSLFFEEYGDSDAEKTDRAVYFNNGQKGKLLKSSTTFIRDLHGTVVGAVCINFDVSELLKAQNTMQRFVDYEPGKDDKNRSENEVYYKSVNELLDEYLQMIEKDFGKPAPMLNKSEKLQALEFLDKQGVLQISKSNITLCKYFGISKFTLYTYLDEIHKKQLDQKQPAYGMQTGGDEQ